MSLTESAIKERLAQIEAELELDHTHPNEKEENKKYLTKSTEESYLNQIARYASQIPRGAALATANIVSLPSLVTRGYLPGGNLPQKLNEYLDKAYPGSRPMTFNHRALSNLSGDFVGGGALRGAAKGIGKVASKGVSAGEKFGVTKKLREAALKKVSGITNAISKGTEVNRKNIGAILGSNYVSQHIGENPNATALDYVFPTLVGSFTGKHIANIPEKTKALKKKYQEIMRPKMPTDPSEMDDLVKKSIDSYQTRIGNVYNKERNLIDESINKSGHKVSLEKVKAPLQAKLDQMEHYKSRRDFLDTEEGKVLRNLWEYPNDLSLAEAKALQERIRKKVDTLGGFDLHQTSTGRDFSAIDYNFKKAIEETASKADPKLGNRLKRINAMWTHKHEKRMPLIEDILKDQHLKGEVAKSALEKSDRGLTHADFILKHLKNSDDKKKFAQFVTQSLKKNGVNVSISQPKKSLSLIAKNKEKYFGLRPDHVQKFYSVLGEPNLSPFQRHLSSTKEFVKNALTPTPNARVNVGLSALHSPRHESEEDKIKKRLAEIEREYPEFSS